MNFTPRCFLGFYQISSEFNVQIIKNFIAFTDVVFDIYIKLNNRVEWGKKDTFVVFTV